MMRKKTMTKAEMRELQGGRGFGVLNTRFEALRAGRLSRFAVIDPVYRRTSVIDPVYHGMGVIDPVY